MTGKIVGMMRDAQRGYAAILAREHTAAMDRLRKRSCDELCAIYNRATNPAAFRTDHQHARNAMQARAALYALRRHYLVTYHYRETASGRMEAV